MPISEGASDFILSTYNPKVALFSTPEASAIAAKNNLTITQLLAPFCKVQCDVSWHEPLNGQTIIPRGLRITPSDVTTQKRLDLDSQSNKRFLQDIVAKNIPNSVETEDTRFHLNKGRNNGKGSSVSYNVEAPRSTPWFTTWREKFLKIHAETQSTQYDFLQHYMACIFVMSSKDGQSVEELSETVGKLSKVQQQHQTSWSNTWAFPSVLKFYLVLHEKPISDQERADAMYQNLRTTYGGNFCFMVQLTGNLDDKNANDTNDHSGLWDCFLEKDFDTNVEKKFDECFTPNEDQEVVFNSKVVHPLSPSQSDNVISTLVSHQNGNIEPNQETMPSLGPGIMMHGQHLSPEDIKVLQSAVNEFVSKALLPYIDRQSRLLHESIVNRRGMSKSFFSATKRLFGGSAKTPSSIVYTNESLEMMSRKLADIYFIFGHYAGSYQLYHQLKKDFLGDSAWVYYASSLEMAAVSHFMMSQVEPPLAMTRAFPVHYATDAITYFIDTCRMSDSAMKCALICCECLKQMGNYSEAAAIYIRMTSEECELKSALMLEQAAYAFLHVNYIRKYALHCVLAGHRYSKAGLKTHSLKCYLQADKIYAGRCWRFAEDHVHLTIARLQGLPFTNDTSKYQQLLPVPPSPKPIINQKTSIKAPVLNCLKLEYSSLKLLNATSYMGLIRAHNLTPDGHITIQSINYRKEEFKISEINAVPVDKKNSVIQLLPMESRNIIFKSTNNQLGRDYPTPILLELKWELEKPTSSKVSGQSTLEVEDLNRILSLDENLFIFELKHESRSQNDFNSNSCVFCGIELLVHSRTKGNFIFKLEKNSSQSSGNIGPGAKASGDELILVGKTTWTLDVTPLNTYKLKYTVAIMQPGVFNVAPIITISSLDEATLGPRKYTLHSPLLIAHPS